MTHTEILHIISTVVAEEVGAEGLELQRETTAADVAGWDSLAHVRIIVSLEQMLGVRFRIGELASARNVGELADRIASRLMPSRRPP